ncbi:MAG: hypothetical protein V4721_03175 [Bacteroidota bacterium]
MKSGFFAYGSTPEYCGECIEEAIVQINKGATVTLSSWRDLNVRGAIIIYKILEKIDRSDFFCADLTGMNDNVLLELGYAIAKRKPIYLILDTSHVESVKKFRELNFLTTVGYSTYNNTEDIVNNFYDDDVMAITNNLLESIKDNLPTKPDYRALFYIKGQVDTNYSQEIINIIESKKLPVVIDDPVETKIQPLTWYVEQLLSVPAFLSEFSSVHRAGFELHNSKCAFISGMAIGLGLKVLMVAEKPYPAPLDYQDLLQKYTSRESCRAVVEPYLEGVHSEIAELLLKRRDDAEKRRKRSRLQGVHFGEYIAEHESQNLYEYFIETSHYKDLIKSEYNIIVGRKGTGKTATLYFLEDTLSEDPRNHICLIKPINFEVDGLVELFKTMRDEFERGFLTEAIWKFLIYSEISKSLYATIKEKNEYALSPDEGLFISYVEAHESVVLADFSTRLEQELEKINLTIGKGSQNEFKIRVSEILHDGVIYKLRELIKSVLSKNNKLFVLIDNLDKSWRTNSDVTVLSKFILGLLGTVGRIARDFRGKPQEKIKFSFNLTLFIRSDIFKYIMSSAREPDKIEFTRLSWNDPEVFFRLIEDRFIKLSEFEVVAEDLWSEFIVSDVDGQQLRKWIMGKVIPRPRDVIYLFNSAKTFAIARGHIKIEENDLTSAYKDYSNWVFKSILVENGITITQIETFMYQLMGENAIITSDDIAIFMKKSEIGVDKLAKFIDHLVSLSVIGREVAIGKFEFEYEFDSDTKIKTLAEKLNSKRFKIHPAFTAYLESIDNG